MSIGEEINSLLKEFEGIGLKEVQKASLMRRKDSKYLLPFEKLPLVLKDVTGDYRVLEIEGRRSHNYQTLYYDTMKLDMYHMHHRGRVNRHKVRFRKYDSSDTVFLEVKEKDAKGVTVKTRIRSNGAAILSMEEEFLSDFTPYSREGIIPVLENNFIRITLVRHDLSERVTLDYGLWFSSRLKETSLELPGIGIAEIKYGKHLSASPFHSSLRRAGVVPKRFSKYCVGMAMLDPDLKQNLFKEKVLRVRKLNSQYLYNLK